MNKIAATLLMLLLFVLGGPPALASEQNSWVSEDFDVSVTWSDRWSDAAGPALSSPDRAYVYLGSGDLTISISVFPTKGKSLTELVDTHLVRYSGATLYHRPWDRAYGALIAHVFFSDGYVGFEFRELRMDTGGRFFYLISITLDSPDLPALENNSAILDEIKIVGPDRDVLSLELPSDLIPTAGFPELVTPTPTATNIPKPTQTSIPTSTPLPTPTPNIAPRPTQPPPPTQPPVPTAPPLPTQPPVDCSGYADWRQKTNDRVGQLDTILNDLTEGLKLPGSWRGAAKGMALGALESLWSEILADEPAPIAADAEPNFQQGISEYIEAVRLLSYQPDDLPPVYTAEINAHLDAASVAMEFFISDVLRLDTLCGYSG